MSRKIQGREWVEGNNYFLTTDGHELTQMGKHGANAAKERFKIPKLPDPSPPGGGEGERQSAVEVLLRFKAGQRRVLSPRHGHQAIRSILTKGLILKVEIEVLTCPQRVAQRCHQYW
jgi:hypothetical protein